MLLRELIDGLETLDITGNLDVDIIDVEYNSNNIKNQSLFVCIDGFKTDGHKFATMAVDNGAVAMLVQKNVNVPKGITVIKVNDTRLALSYVSNVLFGRPSSKINVIGVTGTKGKTTTTYMIKYILEAAGRKTGLLGTIATFVCGKQLRSERTTPESSDLQKLFSDMLNDGVDDVIMEVSSHALQLQRVSEVKYNIGIFMNLSRDHLDFHETFENYLGAKIKLFGLCKRGIVNIDNGYGIKVLENSSCDMITFGIDNSADIMATDIKQTPTSVEFNVVCSKIFDNMKEHVKINIPGKMNVYNGLAAIGAACLMGIPFESIRSGLENVTVPGRAEIVPIDEKYTVMVDYAHSPDSLENILNTVKGYAKGKVICVFGCGGDRDKSKRAIMGEIAGNLADFVIITSDNPRTEEPYKIMQDIEVGIKKTSRQYVSIEDREEAISRAMNYAQEGDVVLIAGKGHEDYQILNDRVINLSDREVVKKIFKDSL